MSKKVVLCNTSKEYFNSTPLFHLVIYMSHNMYLIRDLFKDSRLHDLSTGVYLYNNGSHDLVGALQTVGKRECYKPQDKFYGVLGILGYKDFIVDYNINMEDLNKKMVQCAYSRGDISWISVYGTINKGFLQPMYEQSVRIGTSWKEIGKHMRFEDDSLYVPSRSFATVIRSEKCDFGSANKKFTKWIVLTLNSWGYTLSNAVIIITAFEKYPEIVYEMVDGILRLIVVDADLQQKKEYMRRRFPTENTLDNSLAAERAVAMTDVMYSCSTLVEVRLKETNEKTVLMVYGNADIGDEIKVLNVYDEHERIFGVIVSDAHEHKAFTYSRIDKYDASYEMCRILL